MKYRIATKFERVGLHDSFMSNINISGGDVLIDVDGGYLENYEEGEIFTAILFKAGRFVFSDVESHQYIRLNDFTRVVIDNSTSLTICDWLIQFNEFEVQADRGKMIFTISNNFGEYLEWSFLFKQGNLTWAEFQESKIT